MTAGRFPGPERSTAAPRVLALLHLPPPLHGLSLKNQRMLDGAVSREVDLRVIPYRFARSLEDLGRTTPRKLLLAGVYLGRQLLECVFRRPDVGYLTASMAGGGLLRDAIHVHLFRLFRVPCVLHVPGMGLPETVEGMNGAAGRLVRSALNGLAAAIALNRLHADELSRVVPSRRVVVIANALPDLPEDRQPAPRPGSAGAARGAPVLSRGGGQKLLFLSNMLREKGPFVLLEALPRVLSEVPDVEATFAGGWTRDEDRQRFLARVRELGLEDRVRELGSVDNARKIELLDQADLLVFPSFYPTECSPNVVIEAMRHGLPIVATRHAGIPELVEDGRSALLVKARDVVGLAAAIVRVLADPAMAARLGAAARRRAAGARAARLGAAARRRYEERHRQERWDREVVELLSAVAEGSLIPERENR